MLRGCIFTPCCFVPPFKNCVQTITRMRNTERSFKHRCLIPFYFLCLWGVFSASAGSIATSDTAERCYNFGHMQNVTDQTSWIIFFFSHGDIFAKSLFHPFLCPRVPHTSIPVWLDLKGRLEGWQPSLTSQRCASGGEDHEWRRDERGNCRWGRAGRELF